MSIKMSRDIRALAKRVESLESRVEILTVRLADKEETKRKPGRPPKVNEHVPPLEAGLAG